METKTLNIISIIVVILLLIFGWFFVFNYGKIDNVSDEELEENDEALLEDTCSRFPDSPVCNPNIEPLSDEELEANDEALLEDTCSRFPDSPIC